MEKFKERRRRKTSPKKTLLYGVGIQDAPYVTRYRDSKGKELSCPFFGRWKSMLKRCYAMPEKHPSYKECYVCEDWLTFTRFRAWMETQDWEGKELDKDLLIKGNSLYSPSTCVFVPQIINNFLTENKSDNTSGFVGASLHKCGGFQANCHNPFTGKVEYLGLYKTREAAHTAWGVRKNQIAREIVTRCAIENQDVVQAILSRYSSFEKYEKRDK